MAKETTAWNTNIRIERTPTFQVSKLSNVVVVWFYFGNSDKVFYTKDIIGKVTLERKHQYDDKNMSIYLICLIYILPVAEKWVMMISMKKTPPQVKPWAIMVPTYERIAQWGGSWFRTDDIWISGAHFDTHCGGQRANHSTMTHPTTKRIGTSRNVSHIW